MKWWITSPPRWTAWRSGRLRWWCLSDSRNSRPQPRRPTPRAEKDPPSRSRRSRREFPKSGFMPNPRRSFLYLFPGTGRQVVGRSWEGVADMVRAYMIGNFVLGLMLAAISASFFFLIKLPYWPLIGPLSGFLSLVPYVGLPLAIIPPIAAGLIVYNQPAIYVMIAVVVAMLHLTALNFLYPKVVGSRVHLNPLVVTVALMFWGTLWGGIGLLLAIPITAGIKAVCDNVSSLQGFGKLLGD